MEEIKIYEVDGSESEVFAISLVCQPAIEKDFVYMAKEEKRPVMLMNDEKRKLYGCVLRANHTIYRNNPKYGEYFLRFSPEAIEKIQKRYMQEELGGTWTVDHKKPVDGVHVIESWIKLSEQDKSTALGIGEDCAPGSWFIGATVDNNDVWDSIKLGKQKGFSIESILAIAEEQIFSKQTPKEEEEKKVEMMEEATEPAPEPATETPATNEEVSPNEPPPVPDEAKVEEQTPEPEETKPEEAEQPNPLDDVVKQLQAEVEALKNKNEELEESVKGLKKENKKLSQLPSTDPTNTNGGQKTGDTWKAWRQVAKRYY